MKLLYFTRTWSDHDARFVRAFTRSGINTSVLSLRAGSRTELAMKCGGLNLGDLGLGQNPDSDDWGLVTDRYRMIEGAVKPDIVIAGPLTDCAFVVVSAGTGRPWIAQSWAFDVFWENEHDQSAEHRLRLVLQNCPALFADCVAVVSSAERIRGRPMPRCHIMPWGLEERSGFACCSDLIGNVGARDVFLHTRGLEPIYAPDSLLEAWRRFIAGGGDGLLLLAGEGSLRPKLENIIVKEKLSTSVRLIGQLTSSELEKYFQAADFYVSCAACDGTSVSLLEAMAAGLPAIVNERGGNGEWIISGENGWIVPFGDCERLALTFAMAVHQEPAFRLHVAARNRSVVAARANWRENFTHYTDFIQDIVSTSA